MWNGQRVIDLRDGNIEIDDGVMFDPLWRQDMGGFHRHGNIKLIEPELRHPRAFSDEARRARIVAIMAQPILKRARKHSRRKQCDTEEENATARLSGKSH